MVTGLEVTPSSARTTEPVQGRPAALHTKKVVDDMVCIEPMVGDRATYSRNVAISTARAPFYKMLLAVNVFVVLFNPPIGTHFPT